MPSKTKMKNAAIAARSAALPSIPKELLDQFVKGPMSAEAIRKLPCQADSRFPESAAVVVINRGMNW